MLQEPWCVRGKEESNKRRRSESDLQCHLGSLPQERNGMSVIAFWQPAMCCGVNGDTWVAFKCSARARSNCAATADCLDASRVTQLTVGLLLLNKVTWLPRQSWQTSSITNHKTSRPAISRSE